MRSVSNLKAVLVSGALLAITSVPVVAATPTPVPEVKADLSSMAFFIGTWTCHQSLRGSDRPNTTTYAMTLDDQFMSENDVAPPFDKYRTKTIVADARVTHNPLTNQWIRFDVDSFGNYGVATSPGWEGSKLVWTDTMTSDGATGMVTVTKVSDTETNFVGVSRDKSGKLNPEQRGVCKKST